MRFWDSSALVALTARDKHLERVEPLASEDRKIAVWWAARVECVSAFRSRVRAGDLTGRGEMEAAVRLDALAQDWVEIQPLIAVRNVAERLVRRYVLSAADALQLAAALDWAGEQRQGLGLVTFDQRLADAARLEGFTVLPA
ncbi:MAG: PIN domain-containing protein [Gemmatimonadales bacterium]